MTVMFLQKHYTSCSCLVFMLHGGLFGSRAEYDIDDCLESSYVMNDDDNQTKVYSGGQNINTTYDFHITDDVTN